MAEKMLSKDMTMGDILQAFPGARRALFQRYHVGGCSSCGFSDADTLEVVCRNHNILDVQEVIDHVVKSDELDRKIQVSPQELKARLDRGEPLKLLDVREGWEHELAKIDGATLVTQEGLHEIMNWPPETPIVVHCHYGIRSLDAASYLIGHGLKNVKSLAGGIDAWSREIDKAVPVYE
jgi:rhodanese-related sulfurtransferase